MKQRTFTILSSFYLKVFALLFMTLDHIGWMMLETGGDPTASSILRYLGRLALPLFCFMIVEGVIHTRKSKRYFHRLFVMLVLISLTLFVTECAPEELGLSLYAEGNIFVDLLLGAITIYLLKQKNWKYKLLIIFPVAFAITSFVVTSLEYGNSQMIMWWPFFIRPQYHFYSLLMMILIYLAHPLANVFLKWYSDKSGIAVDSLKGTYVERYSLNIFSAGAIVIACLTYFLMSFIIGERYTFWTNYIQNAAMISGAFVLLYNGKRGYNAKWFQYGSYAYYPLHLLLVFGIGYLILILG